MQISQIMIPCATENITAKQLIQKCICTAKEDTEKSQSETIVSQKEEEKFIGLIEKMTNT